MFCIHPLDCNISFEVQVPMYFESTKFCNIIDAISTIVSLEGCKVKEPKIPEKTKATTFPQNIKCTVPGVFCATIRYYCLPICILNLL